MAKAGNDFPVRVIAIAAVLALLLAVAMWFVYDLGSPASAPEEPVDGAAGVADDDVPSTPMTEGSEDEQGPSMTDGLADTESVTLQLFVVDPVARRLVPRTRIIDAPMTLPSQAQLALDLLVRVRDAGVLAPLPRDTVIREVWVSPAGVAYVDFAETFPALLDGGSMSEIHAVYGVVATLTGSFPNIHSVQFLVNGEPVDTLNGHVDLSRPVEPLSDWAY
jgi:spore germination protein GerM